MATFTKTSQQYLLSCTKRIFIGTVAFAYLLLVHYIALFATLQPAMAAIPPSECSAGSFPSSTNIIQNGDFFISPSDIILPGFGGGLGYNNTDFHYYADANFYSQTANVGFDVHPSDVWPFRNQFSIQTGLATYPLFPEIYQEPFPGDPVYGVPQTDSWFYSNGNALNGVEYINWEQDVGGLTAGRQYVFVSYISSLLEPPFNPPHDPIMSLRIGGTTGRPDGTVILNRLPLTEAATGNTQPLKGWHRVAFSFTATGPTEKLKITDTALGILGDDFAMTAVNLQECVPIQHDWEPIMRAYGNDVVAGGGFTYNAANMCATSDPVSVTAPPFIRGKGKYNPPLPQNHTTYAGSGSELGAFTPGDITGFLPGAQTVYARSRPWELAFANTVSGGAISTNPGTFKYGGGFAHNMCPSYPTPNAPTLLPAGVPINLAALGVSGDYVIRAGTADVFGTVRRGVRIRLFVINALGTPGDVFVSSNIRYIGSVGGWTNPADIPRLEVYGKDLLVSEDASEMSGIFKSSGYMYTCVARNRTIVFPNRTPDISSPPPVGDNEDYIARNCQSKLTAYGSVTTERTYMYRTKREGIAIAQFAEPYTSDNLSEAYVFSPELYISYLSAPVGIISTGKYDSLVSLPPSY